MQFGPAPRRALSYSFQSRQPRGCLAHWLSLQSHSSPAGGHVELTAHNPTFRAHLDALAYRTPPDERSSCRRVLLSFLVDGRSSVGRSATTDPGTASDNEAQRLDVYILYMHIDFDLKSPCPVA